MLDYIIQHYLQYASVVAYLNVEATVTIVLKLLKTVTVIDGCKISFVSIFTHLVNNLLLSSCSLNNVS